jgi:hypothetical protein
VMCMGWAPFWPGLSDRLGLGALAMAARGPQRRTSISRTPARRSGRKASHGQAGGCLPGPGAREPACSRRWTPFSAVGSSTRFRAYRRLSRNEFTSYQTSPAIP